MTIGNDSTITAGMHLGHGTRIGDNVTIVGQAGTDAEALVGDGVTIGSRAEDSSWIGSKAEIGAKCDLRKVRQLAMGNGARMGKDVRAEESIRMEEHAHVGDGAFLRNAQVKAGAQIPTGCRVDGYVPTKVDPGENERADRYDPSAVIEKRALMGATYKSQRLEGTGRRDRGENTDIRENVVIGEFAQVGPGSGDPERGATTAPRAHTGRCGLQRLPGRRAARPGRRGPAQRARDGQAASDRAGRPRAQRSAPAPRSGRTRRSDPTA